MLHRVTLGLTVSARLHRMRPEREPPDSVIYIKPGG